MGPRGTIGLCVAITAVVHVVTYLLNTQLPLHLVALGGSHAQIGWLFAVTTSAAMVLRPQVGGWTDRYGARAVMLPGAGILVLTMAVLNLAATPLTFIALMAPLGIANALISTTGSIVVADQSPPERRGESLALYYTASSVGVALGPAIGFALAEIGGARLNFAVVVGPGGGRGRAGGRGPHDPGDATAPGGLGRLWSPHAVPASIALIVITLGAATVYAFLPLHAAAGGLGRVAWFFPLMSGCTILCRVLLRRASDQFGRTRVLVPALIVIALGHVALATPPTVAAVVLGAVLLGCGNSMLYPTLVALVVDRTPANERGRAIGTLSGAWDVGLAIGSPLIALLVQHHGFSAGFLASGLAAALGLGVFLATERRRVRASPIAAAS